MAFEIFKPKKKGRTEEASRMFQALALSQDLSAKVDMSVSQIYYYAKKLGYKVWIRDNYDGTSTVKVERRP